MQVKHCKFFVWHDRLIDDERVKVLIIELRDANKDLEKHNLFLKNENRAMAKMVGKLKAENGYLRKISSSYINDYFCDEVIT